MRGDYVEFGLHGVANSFGSASTGVPDPSFHLRSNKNRLGFVADYGRDGWTVGTPAFSGDYFTPGSPFEGWGVEFDGVAYENAGLMGKQGVQPENATLVSNDGVVTWVGRQGDLRVTQQTSIFDGDSTTLGLEVTVTLTNLGASELSSLCYTRNVDPDQEQPWTSDYDTTNSIYYQPTVPEGIDGQPNPYDFAAVVATGTQYDSLVQIMLTSDARVRRARRSRHHLRIRRARVPSVARVCLPLHAHAFGPFLCQSVPAQCRFALARLVETLFPNPHVRPYRGHAGSCRLRR